MTMATSKSRPWSETARSALECGREAAALTVGAEKAHGQIIADRDGYTPFPRRSPYVEKLKAAASRPHSKALRAV